MFSALKKLVGTNDSQHAVGHTPPGMHTMAQSLQKKFAKGIQYNMKIIIKGDRNVGKTCLFYRLQGQKFKEEYIPTQEIQATCIQWNYKATDDIVKVDVWDVVDKGKKKKKMEGLKLDNSLSEVVEEAALDAEFVDVYKGTNGVIIMLDITKNWTFDYVQKEIPKVPEHIPILVLANHRDMGHHRVTSEDDVRFYIEGLNRSPDAAQIRYAESSMRNGFGLKFMHKFFNLPFLHLQRETLLQQLETNKREHNLTRHELDVLQESEEQNYDLFLEALTNRRRQVAEQLSQTPLPFTPNPGIPTSLSHSQSSYAVSAAASSPTTTEAASAMKQSASLPSTPSQVDLPPFPPATTNATPGQQDQKPGFMARLFGKSSNASATASNAKPEMASSPSQSMAPSMPQPQQRQEEQPVKSVEDFIPDDTLDKFFLEEEKSYRIEELASVPEQESDSEEEVVNPMVASFQDELDPEDAVGNDRATLDDTISNEMPDLETLAPAVVSPYVFSIQDSDEENELEEPGKNLQNCPVSTAIDSRPLYSATTDSSNSEGSSEPVMVHPDENGQIGESNLSKAAPYVHSLELEDLSVLEKGLGAPITATTTASSSPRKLSMSSQSGDNDNTETLSEDSNLGKKKRNKHKDKSKEKLKDDKTKKKQHKKSKDGEEGKEGKKKKKKSKRKEEELDENNELEEFLGGPAGNTVTRAGQDYESL